MTAPVAGPGAESTELRAYSDVEYHFSPDSRAMPDVRRYLRDTWDRRHFIVAMAKADLRGPRSRTGLGELWAVADPLFQAAIYWFLINTIRRGSGDPTERLTILISGIFLFNVTSMILSMGGRSIIRNKGLMLNSTFPRVLLPATEVYKSLLDLGPTLAVYAVIHLVLGAPIGPGFFVIPLLLVIQVLISAGIAMVFATMTVFISDMSNAIEYIQRILFFTTPILYPVSALPPKAVMFLRVNPFFALFASYQACVTGGVPNPGDVFQAIFWAGLLLVFGFHTFVSRERGFGLRL